MKYIILETIFRFSYKPYSYQPYIGSKKIKSRKHPFHQYIGIPLQARRSSKTGRQYIDIIIYERDGTIYGNYEHLYREYIKNKASIINTNIQRYFRNFNANNLPDNLRNLIWGIQLRGSTKQEDFKRFGIPITRIKKNNLTTIKTYNTYFEFKDTKSSLDDLNTIIELYKVKNGPNIDPVKFFKEILNIDLKNLGDERSIERQKIDIRTLDSYYISGSSVVNRPQSNPEATE